MHAVSVLLALCWYFLNTFSSLFYSDFSYVLFYYLHWRLFFIVLFFYPNLIMHLVHFSYPVFIMVFTRIYCLYMRDSFVWILITPHSLIVSNLLYTSSPVVLVCVFVLFCKIYVILIFSCPFVTNSLYCHCTNFALH